MIMICCLLIADFSAAAQKTITVGNATGIPEGSVNIGILVDDPGNVTGIAFTLTYDTQYLTFQGMVPAEKSMDDGAEYPSPKFTESYAASTLFFQYNHDDVSGRVMITAASVHEDLETTLFYAGFTLKADCPEGVFPIGIEPSIVNNPDAGYAGDTEIPVLVGMLPETSEIHEVTLVAGSVTAEEAPEIPETPSVIEVDSLTPELTIESVDTATGTMNPDGLWQISTDPEFSADDLVFEVMKDADPGTLIVPMLVLKPETTYYVRVNADTGADIPEWMPVISVLTPSDVTERTSGIPSNLYDPDLDVNGNGTDDIDEDIISLKNVVDGVDLGIAPSNGTEITMIDTVDPVDINDPAGSRPDEFPFGLISFRIELDPGVETAELIVYFTVKASDNAMWYKYDSVNNWRIFTDAVFNDTRMSVTLLIEDGGEFDADGVKNGVIIDPSGLGVSIPQAFGGRDSNDGFCFLEITRMEEQTVSERFAALIHRIITGFAR